jgi:hypothetical protein
MAEDEGFFGIPDTGEEEAPGVKCEKCGAWYIKAKGHVCPKDTEESELVEAKESSEPEKPKATTKGTKKPKETGKKPTRPQPEKPAEIQQARAPIDPEKVPMVKPAAEFPATRPTKLSEIAIIDGKIDLSSLGNLSAVCAKLAESQMVPKQYRNNPADMMVAALFGMECGLTLFFSLQNVAVVNGRPCLYGDAPLALVRSKGLIDEFFEDFGFVDEDGEYRPVQAHQFGSLESYPDNFAWRCFSRRKGSKRGSESIITVGMCKQAGWWNKRGYEGKPTPWVTTPWRMGKFRPRGFVVRDEYGDAIRGLGIAEIETIDVEGYSEPAMPDGSLKEKPGAPMEMGVEKGESG